MCKGMTETLLRTADSVYGTRSLPAAARHLEAAAPGTYLC